MNRLSAKLKLTAWTTILLILMAGLLMALMFSISDSIISANSRSTLLKVVGNNANELEFDDGKLDLDDIDFYKDGVHIVLYTQEGEHIAGTLPEESIEIQDFQDLETYEITVDGTLYYIYDKLAPVEDYNVPIWIRGILEVDSASNTTNNILQIALMSLPIIIILGAFACYILARRTFEPIDKIVNTAEEISEKEDLSLRINLKKESAEIQKLADTFDFMFSRLEKSFEAEKQFTSDVSHELRTPIAVILAQCEYAIGEAVSLEDKEEALETIQRQSLKVSKLISNLLHITRIDSGIQNPEFETIEVSSLVEEICKEFEVITPHEMKFEFNIEPGIIGEFDITMLTRLLSNLINNGFRYGKEKGTVRVSLLENNKDILLSVIDDGIGIAKEEQDKIWQRFYQVNTSRTSSDSQTMGLGLSMVKQIAYLHKAEIQLDSELGMGSSFTIKFPKEK